jgi:hypothetical protein
MHIDRPDQIAVASKAAHAADPVSASGLVFVLASGTPATRASSGGGRAQEASLNGLVGEVVDVAPVLPLGHAPVVVAAAVRVADEERAHLVFGTKIDDLPLGPSADFVFRPLELLPAPGASLVAALLPGDFSRLLCSLALERTDTASGHDERLARARRHGGKAGFLPGPRLTEPHRDWLPLVGLPRRRAVRSHGSTQAYRPQRSLATERALSS